MEPTPPNGFESIIAAGSAIGKIIQRANEGSIPFVVVPEKYKVENIESLLERPLSKSNQGVNLTFTTPESFCRYVKLHSTDGTHLFASRIGGKIEAVLDYHETCIAGWGRHKCTLVLQSAPEWDKLNSINRRPLSQDAFCDWLEDNRQIIVEPSSAALLELMQNLEGRSDVQFSSAIRLDSGSVRLSYTEEVKVGTRVDGDLTVPTKLIAGAARYRGGPKYKIACRLRHRIENKKLMFTLIIDELDSIIDDAFDSIIEMVAQQVAIKPLI